MTRKSPKMEITEVGGDKYKSLQEAQQAARPELTADLVETFKGLLEKGWLVSRDGKIVVNHHKIKKDRKEKEQAKIYERENRKVFIYALIDPRNRTIRYVGKTSDLKARLLSHIHRSHISLEAWITELKEAGVLPVMEILEETIEKKSTKVERKWIAYYSENKMLLNQKFNPQKKIRLHEDDLEVR